MNSAQVHSGTFSFGRGWELDVIASVVIGGTSMTGGIGTITGTLLGTLFLGVIFNGMTLLDVSLYMQYVIRGALLFGSVLLSIFLPKFKQKLI
jgi:ABC-type xylose transport system permease subunit